jgi:oligo-1,6-glucosidase
MRKWWKEGVVYQIYPRSFMDSNSDGIGDIRGILKKLDYIQHLGVDIVWLNPVYKSPNYDNGYDISDYYSVIEEFGTMADLEDLISEMHKRKMKLVMDLVVNHTSDEHPWFIKSRASKTNDYRDFYYWRPAKDDREPNNWLSWFGGSAWDYDDKTGEYYLHLFGNKQPDLNWENSRVREEIYKMMCWWLDKGIDGFRMDTINMLSKTPGLPDALDDGQDGYVFAGRHFLNGPRIHEYLQEMYNEVLSRYDVMTVGECPKTSTDEALKYIAEERNELNMIFPLDLMEIDYGNSDKWDPIPFRAAEFKRIINGWQLSMQGRGWNSISLMSHDQPRAVSRFGNDSAYRVESAKMLATLELTLQGTPYIYQGEEIGMTNVVFDSIDDYRDIETLNYLNNTSENHSDRERVMKAIHRQSRDNARTPMQWDVSENAGFSQVTPWIKVNQNYKEINVEQSLDDEHSIFHYYKKLIQLRNENIALIYGEYHPVSVDDEYIFSYLRSFNQERFLIILNLGAVAAGFTLPADIKYRKEKHLLGNYQVVGPNSIREFRLHPFEARLIQLS